jgi:hypothetical protein
VIFGQSFLFVEKIGYFGGVGVRVGGSRGEMVLVRGREWDRDYYLFTIFIMFCRNARYRSLA